MNFFPLLYELPPIKYLRAESVESAVHWLDQFDGRARILAGGTDLLGLMKDNVTGSKMPMPELLIDIKRIPGIRDIGYDAEGVLRIGAAATLHDLESSPLVTGKYSLLAQAASEVATHQIKNMGTIGGNLCQRPWCWYFRVPHFDCFKKGGKQCYAITGNNKFYFSILGLGICVMAHPSDTAPALIALDASVRIAGPSGLRILPVAEFFNGPRETFETILDSNEMLVEVLLPREQPKNSVGVYLKERLRETWDFALASVAIQANRSATNRAFEQVRIVLGGVAPFPYRVPKAEELLIGKIVTTSLLEEVAEVAVQGARPLSMNAYKIPLLKALVKRALQRCAESG